MIKYPKIQTVYLRDPDNKYKTLLDGQFALPEFEYLAENTWVWTEKIDGTNIRVIWEPALAILNESVTYKGRTDKAQTPSFLLDKLKQLLPLEKFTSLYPEMPMTLYGEGYGAKIQKGGGNYIPDGVDFILFDILVDSHWLKREDIEDIASKLNINITPIVGCRGVSDATRSRVSF
jgi:hypothetical protein